MGKHTSRFGYSCNITPIFAYYQWTRSGWDVEGVRAPIQMRLDGGLCSNSATDSTWIAVQNSSNTLLNQAGVIHWVNSAGTHEYCRFYGYGSGTFKAYDCGVDANDTNIYFKIHTWNGGLQYLIADCGTSGGYQNCTVKYDQDNVYVYPKGEVAAEIHDGCDVHIMGSSGDQQNVGNSNYYVQGLDASGTWASRQWGDQGVGDCTTYYQDSEQNSGETMKYYDTRNSQ